MIDKPVDFYNDGYLEKTQKNILDAAMYRTFGVISKYGYFSGLNLTKESRVLEYGAGLGQNIKWIKNSYAYDISKFSAKYCSSKGISVINSEKEIQDMGYDLILSAHCLEHLERPLDNLKFLYSKLKVGGHLILVIPYERHSVSFNKDDPDKHLYSWNFRCIYNLLKVAGFEIKNYNYVKSGAYAFLSKFNLSDKFLFDLISFFGRFSFLNPKVELRIVCKRN